MPSYDEPSFDARLLAASSEKELRALLAEVEQAEQTQRAGVVRTLREVANWFGVVEQTVKQWRCEAEPMPGEPGAYDLREITRWRIRKAERGVQAQQSTRSKVQEELELIELARERLKLEKEQGNLVRREAVLAEARSMAAALSTRFALLPDELVAVEPDAERRTRLLTSLKGVMVNLLKEVALWSQRPTGEEDEDEAG